MTVFGDEDGLAFGESEDPVDVLQIVRRDHDVGGSGDVFGHRSVSSNSISQISLMSVIVTVMVIMEGMRCRYLIAFMPSVRVSAEGD